MSRLAQKPAVAAIDPWRNISTGVPNQAYSSIPDGQAQPTTGTGFYGPGFQTLVGQKFDTSDGRELVLVRNGTTAIAAGKLMQGPAEATGHEKLAMTVPAAQPATAGTTAILVTNGATVLNVNRYQGGYAIVASGTGAGQTFKIASHQPAAASATFIVNLEDPIQTTLDATSTITLQANPYDGIIVTPGGTATGALVGVSLNIIAASTAATFSGTTGALTANGVAQYGLIVCHGPVACLIASTTTIGFPLGPSQSVAGALTVATLTTAPQCAISSQTQTDTQYGQVFLML